MAFVKQSGQMLAPQDDLDVDWLVVFVVHLINHFSINLHWDVVHCQQKLIPRERSCNAVALPFFFATCFCTLLRFLVGMARYFFP